MSLKSDNIKSHIREKYGKIAQINTCGCCDGLSGCCGSNISPEKVALELGYTQDDLKMMPEASNMGLGCGNPQAITELKKGEAVLDLGSGGGIDCFLASRAVGESGQVIGVDMTQEMIDKSSRIAAELGYSNVEFRLGEIENMPLEDNYVDVVMSNCVINLSPEKSKVFEEVYRVLKSGGRLAVSDIVAAAELPPEIKNDLALYGDCIAGAELIDNIEKLLKEAGFENIRITPVDESREFIRNWVPGKDIQDFIVSANIQAVKS